MERNAHVVQNSLRATFYIQAYRAQQRRIRNMALLAAGSTLLLYILIRIHIQSKSNQNVTHSDVWGVLTR